MLLPISCQLIFHPALAPIEDKHRCFHMLVGKASLDISRIWRPNWAIRCQLDARALDERTRSHNDVVRVARHIRWFRCVMRIDGRVFLDCSAEGNHLLRISEGYGLNQVCSLLRIMWCRIQPKSSRSAAVKSAPFTA